MGSDAVCLGIIVLASACIAAVFSGLPERLAKWLTRRAERRVAAEMNEVLGPVGNAPDLIGRMRGE